MTSKHWRRRTGIILALGMAAVAMMETASKTWLRARSAQMTAP